MKRIAEDESSREFSDRTLYVSIEGQQDFSSFILETTFGNTCKLSQIINVCILKTMSLHAAGAPTHLLSVGLLLSLLMLIVMFLR